MAALLASPPFSVSGWAWVHNSASTIRQGAKKGTDATVLKTKLSLNWNGSFKILAVVRRQPPTPPTTARYKKSCSSSMYLQTFRDGTPNHASPFNDASPATTRTTPATYPSTYQRTSQHTSSQLPLPSPPPTTSPSTMSHQHRSASRLSRSPATNLYAAAAESSPSYTSPTGADSSAPRGNASSTFNTSGAILYSTGTESRHNTVRPTASTARCASAPHPASSPDLKANSSSPPATPWSPRDLWLRNFRTSIIPSGAHVWYKARGGLWCLGKIAHRAPPDVSLRTPPDPSPGSSYIIRFLDDPGPIKIDLQLARYTTARNAVSGSWCLNAMGMGAYLVGCYRTLMLPAVPLPVQLPPLVSFGCFICFWLFYSSLGLVLHGQYNSFDSITSWLGLSPMVALGIILHSQPSTCSHFSGMIVVILPTSSVFFSSCLLVFSLQPLSGFGFGFNIVVSLAISPLVVCSSYQRLPLFLTTIDSVCPTP